MLAIMGSGKTALITGASGGIGADLARLFIADGHSVILVARNAGVLAQMEAELSGSGNFVRTIVQDLNAPDAAENIFQTIEEWRIPVDYLVNNAGLGAFGPFVDSDAATILEILQVNIVTLTHLTRLFLDTIILQQGRILNVSSTAAFQPGPLMAVYYASKAYVQSFTEAIANELSTTGVTVTALCPGPVRTGFQKRANMEDSGLVSGKLLQVMDSQTVARAGYRGMMKGKSIVIPGFMNRLGVFGVRIGPRKMVTKIARALQERRS